MDIKQIIESMNIEEKTEAYRLLLQEVSEPKEPEKWKPWQPSIDEEYFTALTNGEIFCHTWMGDRDDRRRAEHGSTFRTEEQAKIASAITKRNNLIMQYIFENEPNWDGGGDSKLYRDTSLGKWVFAHATYPDLAAIVMPEKVAKKLAKDLNSGRVVLPEISDEPK